MTTPVSKVAGIGPKTAEYLQEKGIETAEALLKAGKDVLIEAPGFSEAKAESSLASAAELVGGDAKKAAPKKSAAKKAAPKKEAKEPAPKKEKEAKPAAKKAAAKKPAEKKAAKASAEISADGKKAQHKKSKKDKLKRIRKLKRKEKSRIKKKHKNKKNRKKK